MSQPTPSGAAAPSTAPAMPIMYTRPEALNPARHAGLGLVARPGFEFARKVHACPIMAAEMPAAMRTYPVVFTGADHMPVVVTGIRRDENLFVGADGAWSPPHYVPGYVRRYPFVLSGQDGAGKMTLCVERDPDYVVSLDGAQSSVQPLFDGDQPSETTRKAMAFCEQYQAMVNATRAITAVVAEHGLFIRRNGKVTLDNGEVANINDFDVIDEAAFNALSDEAFIALRKAGALALVYCHFASMNAWPVLLYQANRRRATSAA
jgi:hypothetical protein